jgi:hypothetical protein
MQVDDVEMSYQRDEAWSERRAPEQPAHRQPLDRDLGGVLQRLGAFPRREDGNLVAASGDADGVLERHAPRAGPAGREVRDHVGYSESFHCPNQLW